MNKSALEIIKSIDYSYRSSKDIRVYKAGARKYHEAVEKLRSMGQLWMLEQHEKKLKDKETAALLPEIVKAYNAAHEQQSITSKRNQQ